MKYKFIKKNILIQLKNQTDKPVKFNKKTPELIVHFAKVYPLQFSVALLALVFAGLIETIGIGALLPLLNLIFEVKGSEGNFLTNTVTDVFTFLGLSQNFQNLLGLIVVAIFLKSIIIFLALRLVSFISIDVTYDLRQRFIKSLLHAEWTYYSKLNIGHSANAIATETDQAGNFCFITGKTISSAIQAAIYIVIAFTIDWKVSIAAIMMGGIVALILKFLVIMSREAGNQSASVLNAILSRLNEALSSVKAIKSMGEEARYSDLLNQDTLALQSARKKLTFASLLLNQVHEPIFVLFMEIGITWGYVYASYPISELFLMAFLFSRLLGQINMVQNHYQKTAIFEGAVNSILQKIDIAESHKEQNHGNTTHQFQKEIKIENLGLSYGDVEVLNRLSFNIPAREMSVIFGPSGVGKSSLLDAILGLTPYQSGDIKIDDTSLRDIDIKQWRSSIGYVPQETFLLHDTIGRNVTLGADDIPEERIIEALKKANAWQFVKSLDGGIHHIVGERGGKLSGGQRQRISVARALVRNPEVIILDEATSSLDKKSEDAIISTIKGMLPEVTILMITHDPEVLKIADNVLHLGKED